MLNNTRLAIAALLGAALVGAAARGDEPRQLLRTPIAELYGAPSTLDSASLSPDGSRVAAIRTGDGGATELIVRDFARPEPSAILKRPAGGSGLRSCRWKTDTRLLCSMKDPKNDLTRWLAVNADGTGETNLREFDRIIHILPDQPARVLVTGPPRVYATFVDVETGKRTPLLGSNDQDGRIADGTGAIRVRPYYQSNSQGWAFLPAPKSGWVVLHEEALNTEEWFHPLDLDERTDEVLYAHLAADRLALFAWDGHEQRRVVHAEPVAQVVDVHMVGKPARAGSAVVLDGLVRWEPIDPRVASVRDAVQRSYPFALIYVLDEDWNQRHYLVLVSDRQGAGRYYRFEPREGRLDEVGQTYANLDDRVSAPRATLDLSLAVGRPAAAYVTVPEGARGPLPAVVVPAGTSSWPNNAVPFLVASGFVVIENPAEPLYRGQPFGSSWHAIASEISAAVRELTRSGTIDAGRVCAVGMGLGAYAALMSAGDSPDLFRCVVGIDTTIDPAVGDRMIASVKTAASVPVPVLLFSGKGDKSAARLRGTLEGRGTPSVEVVKYDDTIFESPATPNRIDLLARLGEFLTAHLR